MELLLDTNETQVNNVLELSGKHSKLWEIYTLISPLQYNLPPKLLPYFIPFLNSHIFAFAILR